MIVELWSHPDKPLLEHSKEVANVAVEAIGCKSFNFGLIESDLNFPFSGILPDLVYLSAAFHDLGKATSFFQNYIRLPQAKHDNRKNHALLSAVFVFYTTEKFLEQRFGESVFSRLCSVFVFSAVKRHHGKLTNLSDELLIDPEWREVLPELARSVDSCKVQHLIDELLKDYRISIDWRDFLGFLDAESYDKILEDFSFDILQSKLEQLENKTKLSLYYFHHLIYSILLFSDKNEVILTKKNEVITVNIEQKIFEFRTSSDFDHPKTEIDKLKNESFLKALQNLDLKFKKDKHIYSVTLPTGLGKTITAYMLAAKIRELTGFKDSRIIINIPYTSIIDQNFDVYSKILQTENSNVLLKHHHLADPIYKVSEILRDYAQSKFLIESWQSDTIVTTFVQFLESLLSCDKAKLMKFIQITNSVVLLDEIQTLPYELWETIREVFQTLGRTFNVYFILISATQPLIFNPEDEIVELVPDCLKYFRYFNRTQLKIEKALSFDTFVKNLFSYIQQNPEKDVLCILNTKKAALKTFESICEKIDSEKSEIYFLTTLVTPFERKNIIERIKTPSEKQKIIVSTQLVEAGVDISVNTVFRQLAPLDSILQAAGRANRYNEKTEISEVFVVEIEDYKRASNLVYGSDLLIKTCNVLKNYSIIQEKDYLEVIQKYFLEIRKQAKSTSQPILNALKNLDFGKVDFELIESRKTESVFLQLNKDAKKVWEEYVKIYSAHGLKPWEREEMFSKIKTEFYDFVINVPIPYGSDRIVFDSEKENNFYVSKLDFPSKNYKYDEGNYAQNKGYIGDSNTLLFL